MKIPDALTSQELDDFWGKAVDAFNQATSKQGKYEVKCNIAEVDIDLIYAGTNLRDAFQPALAGIETNQPKPTKGRIFIFDSKSSGIAVPTFDRPVKHLILRRGDCWQDPEAKCQIFFHQSDYTLVIFNRELEAAIVIVSDASQLPAWVFASPLRTPLALLLQAQGVQFVHGAAIGSEDGAILITGYGGSGKSTTALSCIRADMQVLGDDYVAIRPPNAVFEHWQVCNIYMSIKVVTAELQEETFTEIWEGKAIVYPNIAAQAPALRQAPLLAFCCANIINESETSFVACSTEKVARIAYASTTLQIPSNEAKTEKIISACLKSIGAAYQINLGSNRGAISGVITAFLKQTKKHSKKTLLSYPSDMGITTPISVIIPVYNGAQYIGEAIESVYQQGYAVFELIIIDDGSTDNLDSALERVKYPFRLIKQENQGPAAARNTGIHAARGEWLAFLDADDIWPINSLIRRVLDLALHPKAGVVHGTAITFKLDSKTGGYVNAAHPRQNFEFFIGGGLFRRSVFQTVGVFEEKLNFNEDYEWFFRARALTHVVRIPEVTLHVRQHNTNMTNELYEVNKAIQAKSHDAFTIIRGLVGKNRLKNIDTN